jgi:tetratricopeptide (TPR) repeat protein
MAQTSTNGVPPSTNPIGGPVSDSGMNRTGGGTSSAAGFLTGHVVRDDGSPDLANIAIERVCSTSPVTVAHTDARGYFNFRLGSSSAVTLDASQSGSRNTSGVLGSLQAVMGPVRNTPGPGPGAATATAPGEVRNCELRASLPGYHSDTISLTNRRSTDSPDVGLVVLHRISSEGGGSAISATSLAAPRAAVNSFEQGMKAERAGDAKAAAKALKRALELYPRYAEAWFELGFLTARARDWAESARCLDRGLEISPAGYPQAWYADAMAHYYLNDFDAAERSAREAVRQDSGHRNPRAGYVLGMVLAQKRDYRAAASELRAYLERAPHAPDADQVRAQLAEIEGFR